MRFPLHALLVTGILAAQPPQMRRYQVRDPLPVPDVGGYRTLKADFHVHTVFSDGLVWPSLRVLEAWRDGLDVLALTDHGDGPSPNAAILKDDLTLSVQQAQAQADRHGILLIQGVEISPGPYHCNALFVTDPLAARGSDLLASLRRMKAQGAFVFWNHPDEQKEWPAEIDAAHREGLLDGVEIVNEETTYPNMFPFIVGKKLTMLANSDIHLPAPPRSESYQRAMTLVFVRTVDLAGVREALFAGRTVAWLGNEFWGPEELLRGLWEGAIRIEHKEWAFPLKRWGPRVPIVNNSAIPFKFQVRRAPEWFHGGAAEIPGRRVLSHSMSLKPGAPAGVHPVELELEITNMHIAPGRNLTVKVPFLVRVTND
jgi:hypothetical protein